MNTGTMIPGIRQVVTAILMFGSCNKSLFNFDRYVVLEPRVTVRPDGNVSFQSVSSIGNEWAGFLTVLAVDSKPRNRVPDALITFGVISLPVKRSRSPLQSAPGQYQSKPFNEDHAKA